MQYMDITEAMWTKGCMHVVTLILCLLYSLLILLFGYNYANLWIKLNQIIAINGDEQL